MKEIKYLYTIYENFHHSMIFRIRIYPPSQKVPDPDPKHWCFFLHRSVARFEIRVPTPARFGSGSKTLRSQTSHSMSAKIWVAFFINGESRTWWRPFRFCGAIMMGTQAGYCKLAEPLNLVHKYARTEVRRNSFSVRVAEPWNKHSRETREARNVQQFKRLLKNKWK